MAKKLGNWSCYDCIHCVKENPSISGVMAHYKCTSQKQRGFVMGWVQAKSQAGLKTMGGSCCNRLYPGDMIDVMSRFNNSYQRYMYCGKLRGRRLVIGIPDHVPHVVENSWFRDMGGKLLRDRYHIVMQTEEQKEFHRGLAKTIIKEYRHE